MFKSGNTVFLLNDNQTHSLVGGTVGGKHWGTGGAGVPQILPQFLMWSNTLHIP